MVKQLLVQRTRNHCSSMLLCFLPLFMKSSSPWILLSEPSCFVTMYTFYSWHSPNEENDINVLDNQGFCRFYVARFVIKQRSDLIEPSHLSRHVQSSFCANFKSKGEVWFIYPLTLLWSKLIFPLPPCINRNWGGEERTMSEFFPITSRTL